MAKQKLVSRASFAELAGVTGAAITKACAKGRALAPAVVGRKVDVGHPAAVEYIMLQAEPADGRDPLYDLALEYLIAEGKFTQVALRRRFGIGYPRSKALIEAFRADGVLPEKDATRSSAAAGPPRGPGNKSSNPRGKAAAKKKREAMPVDEDLIFEIPENLMAFLDLTLREIFDTYGTAEQFNAFLTAVRRIEEVNDKRVRTAQREGELVNRQLVQRGVIDIFNQAHLRIMTDGAKSIVAGVLAKHAAGAGEVELELHVADILGSFIKPVKNQIARNLGGS